MKQSFSGADIVVIPAGIPRKPTRRPLSQAGAKQALT